MIFVTGSNLAKKLDIRLKLHGRNKQGAVQTIAYTVYNKWNWERGESEYYRGFFDECPSLIFRHFDSICFAYYQDDSKSVYDIELAKAREKPRNFSQQIDIHFCVSTSDSPLLSLEYIEKFIWMSAILREATHYYPS